MTRRLLPLLLFLTIFSFQYLFSDFSNDHFISDDLKRANAILGLWFSPDKNRKIKFYKVVYTNEQEEKKTEYRGKVIWLSKKAIEKIKKNKGDPKEELNHDVFFLEFNSKKKWRGHLLTGKKPKKSIPCSLSLDKKNQNHLSISVFLFKKKLIRIIEK